MRYEVKESSGSVMTGKSFSPASRTVKVYQHLPYASEYFTERLFTGLHEDRDDLIRIFGSAQLTIKTKLQKGS